MDQSGSNRLRCLAQGIKHIACQLYPVEIKGYFDDSGCPAGCPRGGGRTLRGGGRPAGCPKLPPNIAPPCVWPAPLHRGAAKPLAAARSAAFGERSAAALRSRAFAGTGGMSDGGCRPCRTRVAVDDRVQDGSARHRRRPGQEAGGMLSTCPCPCRGLGCRGLIPINAGRPGRWCHAVNGRCRSLARNTPCTSAS